jgi:hypothetical protein
VSADPSHLCQVPDVPNASETRPERLDRLCEVGQEALVKLTIQIVLEGAPSKTEQQCMPKDQNPDFLLINPAATVYQSHG